MESKDNGAASVTTHDGFFPLPYSNVLECTVRELARNVHHEVRLTAAHDWFVHGQVVGEWVAKGQISVREAYAHALKVVESAPSGRVAARFYQGINAGRCARQEGDAS